jgi:hypothetical protein
MTKFKDIRTANGAKTSFSFTVTLFNVDAAVNTLLILHNLLNNALIISENPIETSH